jgi:hypothetical protein
MNQMNSADCYISHLFLIAMEIRLTEGVAVPRKRSLCSILFPWNGVEWSGMEWKLGIASAVLYFRKELVLSWLCRLIEV